MTQRNPQNRIKNWTGTVHFADANGQIACGPVKTHHSYFAWTVEDVSCSKCIAMYGADEVTGNTDAETPNYADEHAARRAAERAARRAERMR